MAERNYRSRNDDIDDELDDEEESGDDRRGRGDRGDRRRGPRRRKEDFFLTSKTVPDYKDVDTLRRFLTDRAKIRPRRQTGLNSKNQRLLARQIKRARHLALLPYTDDQTRL
jgi:small subunit ribosomal protein S18